MADVSSFNSSNQFIDQFSEPLHIDDPCAALHEEECDVSFSMSAVTNGQVCQTASFSLDALVLFLRREHPQSTSAHVSSRIGVPMGTVQNWIDRKVSPNVESFMRLVSAYGPNCLRCSYNEPVDWLDKAILFQRAETLKRAGLQNIIEAGEIAKGIL